MWLLEKTSGYAFAGVEVNGVLYVDISEIERLAKANPTGVIPELVRSPLQSCPWGDLYGFNRILPDVPIFRVSGSLHGGLMVEEVWFHSNISLEFLPRNRRDVYFDYMDYTSRTAFLCYEEDDDWETLVRGYPRLAEFFPLKTGIPF